MVRVLVLCGTGFIGSRVVARLAEEGHEVAVFHRGSTGGPLPEGVRRIIGDRRNLQDHASSFRALAPDVALDMYALSESDARTAVTALRGVVRRLVAVSSQDVYRAYGRLARLEPGEPEPVPICEDAPLRERMYPHRGQAPRLHDYEKILVERVVMGAPWITGTVVRLPMVYGPGDKQHRFLHYLEQMWRGAPTIVLGSGIARWRASMGYVENIAAAIALAVTQEKAAGQVYNVAEPWALTEAEWVALLGRTVGWNGEVVTVPEDRLPPHLRTDLDTRQDLVADSTRIRAELGYREVYSLEEAVRATVAWELSQRPP